jgi:hypothetical protein
MKSKKLPAPSSATTLVTIDPEKRKGALQAIGGSRSDDWNNIVANQAVQALWMKNSDKETRDLQYGATVDALIGIEPKDEIEGMIAAQLLAAHNAAMECYRRAMIGEQTFEGRRENLNQANKLSRTYAALVEGLDRHRGKGQQHVTVEHVHVNQGAHAIVGSMTQGGGGATRSEDQRGAPVLTYEPGSPMWSSDPQRETMPIASNTGKAPM